LLFVSELVPAIKGDQLNVLFAMPILSRFYGIIISIYFSDHPPPHFHARYGAFQAEIDIRTGEIIIGSLPLRASAAVEEWRSQHVRALLLNWDLAQKHQPLQRIEPLE
jgi:hypothetical protein